MKKAPKQSPTAPPKKPEQPAKRQQDAKPSPAAQKAARRVFQFAALLLLTLFLQGLDLPWRMLAVASGAAAGVFGVIALVAAWKSGIRGLTIPAVAVGTVMSILMAFSTLLLVFIWDIQMDFQECKGGAITVSAAEQCEATYNSDFDQWRTDLEGKVGLNP